MDDWRQLDLFRDHLEALNRAAALAVYAAACRATDLPNVEIERIVQRQKRLFELLGAPSDADDPGYLLAVQRSITEARINWRDQTINELTSQLSKLQEENNTRFSKERERIANTIALTVLIVGFFSILLISDRLERLHSTVADIFLYFSIYTSSFYFLLFFPVRDWIARRLPVRGKRPAATD